MEQAQMHQQKQGYTARDALKGAMAGAAAVWVMDRVDWFAYNHEPAEVRQRTTAARPGGMDPAHVMANKAAGMLGQELSPPQPHPLGGLIHYSLGVVPGALYGALRRRVPALTAGRGSLFGFGLFLAQDEVINAAAGWSGKPQEYSWQTHARGLVAHMVYGAVMHTMLGLLSRSKDDSGRQ